MVASLNGTRAPTSKKCVAEKGIVMPNWLKSFQTFWLHSSIFALEKQLQKPNFQSFFYVLLHVSFNEKWTPIPKKFVVEQRFPTPILWKTIENHWSHSFISPLEKRLES